MGPQSMPVCVLCIDCSSECVYSAADFRSEGGELSGNVIKACHLVSFGYKPTSKSQSWNPRGEISLWINLSYGGCVRILWLYPNTVIVFEYCDCNQIFPCIRRLSLYTCTNSFLYPNSLTLSEYCYSSRTIRLHPNTVIVSEHCYRRTTTWPEPVLVIKKDIINILLRQDN